MRVEKMKQAGIITGARIDVSPKQLGYDVGCFIGIILKARRTIRPHWPDWKALMK